MKLDLVRADPSGNATLLVLTPVDGARRAEIAGKLLALDGGWAEQAGFVSGAEQTRLDMMGGEFCGNASLSLAAHLAEARGENEAEIFLSVSGAKEKVRCEVRRGEGPGRWTGSVAMPLPTSAGEEIFRLGGKAYPFWAVAFEGITHVVVPAGALSKGEAEKAAPIWAGSRGADALGLLLFYGAGPAMEPLVCVPAVGSAVWEGACASGAAALGVCLALRAGKSVSARIRQPGGVLGVSASLRDGAVTDLSVGGGVALLGRATVEIDDEY